MFKKGFQLALILMKMQVAINNYSLTGIERLSAKAINIMKVYTKNSNHILQIELLIDSYYILEIETKRKIIKEIINQIGE